MPEDPKPTNPETPAPDPDSIERLIAAIRGVQPAPSAVAAPPTAADDEVAKKFEDLINSGHAADAWKLARQAAFIPQQEQMRALARQAASLNIEGLRSRYGDKFKKREDRFRAKQKEFGIAEESLAEPKMAHDLFMVVLGEDHETFVKEETDSRMAAAEAERKQKEAASPPPSLAPLNAILSESPEPDRARVEKVLKSHGLDDPETLAYARRQVVDVFGIPWMAYIHQLEKEDDPRYTSLHGVGPFRRRSWTMIGDHPEKKAEVVKS